MSTEASGFYYDPNHDVNDHKKWSDMDLFDLKASIENGSTIEEAAAFLCRSNTVEEVEAKARELGLSFRRK